MSKYCFTFHGFGFWFPVLFCWYILLHLLITFYFWLTCDLGVLFPSCVPVLLSHIGPVSTVLPSLAQLVFKPVLSPCSWFVCFFVLAPALHLFPGPVFLMCLPLFSGLTSVLILPLYFPLPACWCQLLLPAILQFTLLDFLDPGLHLLFSTWLPLNAFGSFYRNCDGWYISINASFTMSRH